MNNHSDWYQSFFHGITQEFWAKIADQELTDSEIDFINKVYPLNKQSKVLDVPCGHGRHSLALAQQGHQVFGIDISADSIQTLKSQSIRLGIKNLEVHRADILQYNPPTDFDLAICLGNSFSYFPYGGMLAFCQKIKESLHKTGAFVINTGMLAESILPNLEKSMWVEVDDILFLMQNSYHPDESVLQNDYRFVKDGMVEERTSFHYVYTLAEVIRMLKHVGFKHVDVYGNVQGDDFKLGSSQAYLVARNV